MTKRTIGNDRLIDGEKIDNLPEDTISELDSKQDTLVSGTNIKTVNGNSLVGSGDVTISAASNIAVKDEGTTLTSTVSSFNFVGSGVTATNVGNDVTVTVNSGSGDMTKAVYNPAGVEQQVAFNLNAVHITSSVNPAVPFTNYLVDATSGNITITLPDATNDIDEYRIVLEKDTHLITVTTVGGTQLIGGETSQYIHTVNGGLYLKADGDHYNIIGDTRGLLRYVDITTDTDLSVSGYESRTVYHCIPSGGTITITLPDSSNLIKGTSCTFTLHGTGTTIVKTDGGELIEGLEEQSLTDGAFTITNDGTHYFIVSDTRPKVQNTALVLYSLNEASTIPDPAGGFYSQSCTNTTDPRYSASSIEIVSGTIASTRTYLGGSISDASIVEGLIPGGPVETVLNVARNSGSASFRLEIEIYKRTSGGVETLLGVSGMSNLIDTSTYQDIIVITNINETTFAPGDRIIRKLFGTSNGTPTGKIRIEGATPSFSRINAPATSITHNSLAGIQQAGPGVTNGHISDGTQTIAGTKTFSSTIVGTIDATNALKSATTTVNVSSATAPTAGQVLTATSSTTATWQTPSGGSKTFDITIPGEQIADTSNFQGFYFYNNTGATITISNVAFAVGTAAAGTGAACAFNLYKSSGTAADGLNTNAVNLFTTAVDLGTGYTSLTNVPNTATVENGRWVTARITSSAGATNRASNAKIIVTYS